MHERTRRQLCRLAFVALCVLPTMATCAWVGYRRSPLHAAAERAIWQQKLYDLTGLSARIEHVRRTTGRSTLLIGIVLTDPDGGDQVVRLRQAEIARTPQGIVVLLSQPEVAQGKFLRLWDMLHERVLRGPQPPTPIQITAGELTLEVGSRAQTFTRLRCTIEPHAEGLRALLDFQLAGLEMPAPAQLQIDRNRQIMPPVTSWQLHSDTPIPCSLFSDYLPAVGRLGSRCVFQGSISTLSARDRWSGEISGRFSHIDLESATEPFPHKLTGLADLTVSKAVIQQGTLKEATGELISAGGVVSPTLLAALGKQLSVGVPPGIEEWSEPYIRYERMAFQFALSEQGMNLVGRCSDSVPGVVMLAKEGALVVGDRRRAYPLVGVIRALSPDSEWLVPATDESRGLLEVLALPAARQASPAMARPLRPRVRLQ